MPTPTVRKKNPKRRGAVANIGSGLATLLGVGRQQGEGAADYTTRQAPYISQVGDLLGRLSSRMTRPALAEPVYGQGLSGGPRPEQFAGGAFGGGAVADVAAPTLSLFSSTVPQSRPDPRTAWRQSTRRGTANLLAGMGVEPSASSAPSLFADGRTRRANALGGARAQDAGPAARLTSLPSTTRGSVSMDLLEPRPTTQSAAPLPTAPRGVPQTLPPAVQPTDEQLQTNARPQAAGPRAVAMNAPVTQSAPTPSDFQEELYRRGATQADPTRMKMAIRSPADNRAQFISDYAGSMRAAHAAGQAGDWGEYEELHPGVMAGPSASVGAGAPRSTLQSLRAMQTDEQAQRFAEHQATAAAGRRRGTLSDDVRQELLGAKRTGASPSVLHAMLASRQALAAGESTPAQTAMALGPMAGMVPGIAESTPEAIRMRTYAQALGGMGAGGAPLPPNAFEPWLGQPAPGQLDEVPIDEAQRLANEVRQGPQPGQPQGPPVVSGPGQQVPSSPMIMPRVGEPQEPLRQIDQETAYRNKLAEAGYQPEAIELAVEEQFPRGPVGPAGLPMVSGGGMLASASPYMSLPWAAPLAAFAAPSIPETLENIGVPGMTGLAKWAEPATPGSKYRPLQRTFSDWSGQAAPNLAPVFDLLAGLLPGPEVAGVSEKTRKWHKSKSKKRRKST